jgi:hypothetical protein
MNKNEMLALESIPIDLNDRKSENTITETLPDLIKSGHHLVNLEIKNSSGQESGTLRLDIDLFSKIKEIQDLPDWVIIKLLLADGILYDKDFKKRILNG